MSTHSWMKSLSSRNIKFVIFNCHQKIFLCNKCKSCDVLKNLISMRFFFWIWNQQSAELFDRNYFLSIESINRSAKKSVEFLQKQLIFKFKIQSTIFVSTYVRSIFVEQMSLLLSKKSYVQTQLFEFSKWHVQQSNLYVWKKNIFRTSTRRNVSCTHVSWTQSTRLCNNFEKIQWCDFFTIVDFCSILCDSSNRVFDRSTIRF